MHRSVKYSYPEVIVISVNAKILSNLFHFQFLENVYVYAIQLGRHTYINTFVFGVMLNSTPFMLCST